MKRLLLILTLLVAISATSRAQTLRVGVRIGANATDLSLPKVSFGERYIVSDNAKVGLESAIMARLNITRHLHLQAEFEYSLSCYQVRYVAPIEQLRVRLHANRIELPLMIGVNIGSMHLLCGTFIRIAHSEKSSAPNLVKIKFNDSDVGLMGGLGVNLGRFFIEARISGYPRSVIHSRVESQGTTEQMRLKRHIRYSLSTGILF